MDGILRNGGAPSTLERVSGTLKADWAGRLMPWRGSSELSCSFRRGDGGVAMGKLRLGAFVVSSRFAVFAGELALGALACGRLDAFTGDLASGTLACRALGAFS